MTPRTPIDEDIEVAVLGGGIAGLLAAAYLKKAGVDDVRVIEMGGDFGGVWYWNRFPGIQCDNDAYCYIPLLEELDFMPSKKFADGAEIFEHCRRIGKHFGLYDGALFSTQVRDGALGRSDRALADRPPTAVTTSGPASSSWRRAPTTGPKLPGIPGIKDFKGHMFHSARWDYDYTGGDADGGLDKLADKRVALVGTGATGDPARSAPGPGCQAPLRLPAHAVVRRRARQRADRSGMGEIAAAGLAGGAEAQFPPLVTVRRVWCSASRIWSATSGPNSAAT